MNKPVFRNPDKLQVLPFRDWIRANLPAGNQGYVAEDLDLMLRVYGHEFNTDATGRFAECELKFGNATLDYAQIRTFRLRHTIMRKGDPERERYQGFYLIQYTDSNWDKALFTVNGCPLNRSSFLRFMMLDPDLLAQIPEHPF